MRVSIISLVLAQGGVGEQPVSTTGSQVGCQCHRAHCMAGAVAQALPAGLQGGKQGASWCDARDGLACQASWMGTPCVRHLRRTCDS